MQLSKAESRVDRSNAIYDLTESRVAGVVSAISQASQVDSRSEVQGSGQARSHQPTSVRASSVQQQDPGINIKIYSNYYDKGDLSQTRGKLQTLSAWLMSTLFYFEVRPIEGYHTARLTLLILQRK